MVGNGSVNSKPNEKTLVNNYLMYRKGFSLKHGLPGWVTYISSNFVAPSEESVPAMLALSNPDLEL
jgi:hypothetical protein